MSIVDEIKKDRKELMGVDLGGVNLRGANLSGANLSGANLRGTSLEKANLSGANLRGTSLEKANLYGANLYGANLEKANLLAVTLSGANLYNIRGKEIYTFQAGGHFAYCCDGHIKIGCKTFSIQTWVEYYKEIAKNAEYTSKQTKIYGDWIKYMAEMVGE